MYQEDQVDQKDSSDNENNSEGDTQFNQNQINEKIKEVNERLTRGVKGFKVDIQKQSGKNNTNSMEIKISYEKNYKINFKITNQPNLFFIRQSNFKIENWKIMAESERLTIQYQNFDSSSIESDPNIIMLNVIEAFKDTLFEIYTNLSRNAKKASTLYHTYEQSQLHQFQIPYPGTTTSCWSPQGHLITVHNQTTPYQRQSREEQRKYLGCNELNQFVFSANKNKNQDHKDISKHFVDIQEQDEEFLKAFMQNGMKIISETKEEDYDYLNFDFYSLVLPNLHQQQQNSQQNQTKTQADVKDTVWTKNYEFIDLNDDQYFVIREQFKNLYKKVESQDKKIIINQNVEINMYDFSCYSYNISDNIQRLHYLYSRYFQKKSPNQFPITLNDSSITANQDNPLYSLYYLYQTGLDDCLKIYKTNLPELLFKSNQTHEQQICNMETMRILMGNIHQVQKYNLQNYNMNLLYDFLIYSKSLWNTLYQFYMFHDLLIYQLGKAEYLKKMDEVLHQLQQNKKMLKIKDEYNVINKIKDTVERQTQQITDRLKSKIILVGESNKEEIRKLKLNTTGTTTQKVLNRIKKFDETQDQRYVITTNVKYQPLIQFPYLQYFKSTFNSSVLGNALKVQNIQHYCIFQKLKARGYQLEQFSNEINLFIKTINISSMPLQITHNQKQDLKLCNYYCSVCQVEILKGQIILCNKCNHGGHFTHIQAWFSIEKQCPQCFTCECAKVSYTIIR